MPTLIDGSPTHVLIVHAVVVLLPLSVIAALALVFVPATRKAFGLVSVLVALLACLAVPLAFLSGGKLRARLAPSPLINQHVALAHELLLVAAAFGVVLAAFVGIDMARRQRTGQLNRVEARWLPTTSDAGSGAGGALTGLYRLTAIALTVMAVLTAVMVVRVGDSGAKAAWHDRLSAAQRP